MKRWAARGFVLVLIIEVVLSIILTLVGVSMADVQ